MVCDISSIVVNQRIREAGSSGGFTGTPKSVYNASLANNLVITQIEPLQTEFDLIYVDYALNTVAEGDQIIIVGDPELSSLNEIEICFEITYSCVGPAPNLEECEVEGGIASTSQTLFMGCN